MREVAVVKVGGFIVIRQSNLPGTGQGIEVKEIHKGFYF